MIKKSVGLWVLGMLCFHISFSQVDTTFIYKTGTPYGTLDIRIAKSSTRFYYLQENVTFSFRESSPGVKTKTYRDMTSWDSSPYSQGNLREKNGNADYFIMNYRLLFPVSYNASYSEGYPLIVMIHGLGERANCWNNDCYWVDRTWKPNTNTPAAPTSSSSQLLNNDHNLLHGGSIHLQMRNAAGSKLPNDPTLPERSFPGFVLFPQNLNGWDGSQAQDVIRMIRLMVKRYKIDPNRIYIHGLSNGGAAVYDIVKRAPWLFSAAAPMSAVSDGGINSYGMAPAVSSVRFWIFQGGQDTNPTPGKTESYVKKFKEAGLSVRYTKYPTLGHGTWNTAYQEPDFFSWLRSKHKSDLHVFADNPTLCTTTGQGVKMNLAEGFLAYQWERNGVIISGATSASYTATTTGTYRARFSRTSRTPSADEWNRWSDPVTVVSSSPVQAQVAQVGTTVLKDLNYYNYAHLKSVNTADHYYWYKNGVRIDLSGSVDDTVRYPRFTSTNGNGAYTLVTAGFDNCPSPPSDPVQVFFSDSAPININAPSTFTGSATSASAASLSWTDASSNEKGFEVWRRKKTGTTTYTKWAMATLTNANIQSFNDTGLEPASVYQYKIRAVGTAGRSGYTPSVSTQYLTITTQNDTQNPTVPQNLTATATAIREITLKWQPATDNTGIREYNIYYGSTIVNTGSAVTTYKLTNLALNTDYTFTVRAKDLGDNLSGASNTASADTYVAGLYYEHSTGAFTDLDQINWAGVPEFTGKVDNFTLTPRTQEDYFFFEFDGFLYINTGGSYQFQTSSDDGSRLTVNETVAVENDGTHGTVTVTGPLMTLASGPNTINAKYFESMGGQNLTVRYKGPDTGNAWVVIPNSALQSGTPTALAMNSGESNMKTASSPMNVTVFPNPLTANENLSLQVESKSESSQEPVHVSLFNMMGRSFYDKTFEATEVAQAVPVAPQEKLLKGIYIMVIKQGETTIRQRVIIKD